MPRPTPTMEQNIARFWTRVDKKGPDDCWVYGLTKEREEFWLNGRSINARRAAMFFHLGRDLNGRMERIVQLCGNEKCVNPKHLKIESKVEDKSEVNSGSIYPQRIIRRFWSKVVIVSEDKCWLWRPCRGKNKYGYFWTGEKDQHAHRTILEIQLGRRLIGGEQALHKCDNPPCCNPHHIYLGTHADNMRDKVTKGRSHNVPKGEAHGMSKWTETQVIEIRRLHATGLSCLKIAKILNTDPSGIWLIVSRKLWKHIK